MTGLRLGAAAVGLLALAWGLGLGSRVALAYGVAHGGVLALLWLYPRLALRRVVVTRAMSGSACEDDVLRVRLQLENRGGLPLLAPELDDWFAPDSVPHRRGITSAWLGPGRTSGVAFRGRCATQRGVHPVGPAGVSLTDPVGLYAARRDAGAFARLTVYPSVERVTAPAARGGRRTPRVGGAATRAPGPGDCPWVVREHRPGDSLRRIHWPTTARRGRLMQVDPQRQLAPRVVIALDLARASLRGLGRQATVEVAVRVAAALAAAWLRRGDRVGLVARGERPLRLAPGRGQGHLCRLLDLLATVRPRGDTPLPRLAAELARELRPGEAAALIAADVEEESAALIEAVEDLTVAGVAVVAVLLDPATFPRLVEGRPGVGGLAVTADALAARGATVHCVRAGEPLAAQLLLPWAGRRRIRIPREARA